MVAGAHEGWREKRGGLVERVQREGLKGRLLGVGKCGNKSSANIVGARASNRNRWRGGEGALLGCVIFDVGAFRGRFPA